MRFWGDFQGLNGETGEGRVVKNRGRYFAKKSPKMPKEVNILPKPNLDNFLNF